MSTVVLYPDATIQASGGTKVGGATTHGILGDIVLTSWLEMAPESGVAQVSVGVPTKPAGSVTKQMRAAFGVASISVNSTKFDGTLDAFGSAQAGIYGVQIDGTDVETWTTPWVVLGDLTAAQLGDMAVSIRRSLTGAVTNLRAIEANVQVIFALAPTTSASATVDGTSTTVSWIHTPGEDGGPQAWYRAYLLNDTTEVIVFDTGIVYGSATSATATGLASDDFTWYVQTAQEIHAGSPHWASAVATAAATIPVQSRSEVESVTATADPLQAVVQIEIARDTAEDAWSAVETERLQADKDSMPSSVGDIETGTGGVADGWQIETFGTATATAESIEAGGPVGNYQRFSATLNAGAFRQMSNVESLPCAEGDTVHMFCRFKAAGTGGGAALIVLGFSAEAHGDRGWDEAGEARFLVQSPLVWTEYHLSAGVPAGMRSVQAGFQFNTPVDGAEATIEFDDVHLVVSSAGWTALREEPVLAADEAVGYDFEAPPDADVVYRARAENAGGAVGSWVYAAPVSWEAESLLFTPPFEPSLQMAVTLAVPPSRQRKRREHMLDILGSKLPVVRYDVLSGSSGEFVAITRDEAEGSALEAVAEHGVVFVTAPSSYRFPSGFYRLGDVQEVHLSRPMAIGWRKWRIPFTEVAAP